VKRHIASVASVLLCVVTAVLWVSSGFKPFAVERLGNHWMVQLHVAHGGILFGADAISPNANDYFGWVWYFKDGDEAGFFPAGSTFPYGEFSSLPWRVGRLHSHLVNRHSFGIASCHSNLP